MKLTGYSAKATLRTDSYLAQSRTWASWPSAQGGSPITRTLPPSACSATQRANLSRVRAEVPYHWSTESSVTPGGVPPRADAQVLDVPLLDGDQGRLLRGDRLLDERQRDVDELVVGAIDEGLVDKPFSGPDAVPWNCISIFIPARLGLMPQVRLMQASWITRRTCIQTTVAPIDGRRVGDRDREADNAEPERDRCGGALPRAGPLRRPAAAKRGTKAIGIDVSRFQGAIDWPSVAGAGVRFAFVQASRGSGVDCTVKPAQCGADPYFATNRVAAE